MIRISTTRTHEVEDDVFYPESDGKPMSETRVHQLVTIDLLARLMFLFAKKPSVCVCGDQFLYYERGKPGKVVSPDCFVAFNTLKRGPRDTYKTWEEGSIPACVFEISSKTTKNEDLKTKFKIYQDLGIKEYFLFDPYEEYLHPSLQGFRLSRGEYKPIKLVDGVLESKELGITLERAGSGIKLLHTKNGRPVLTEEEHKTAKERRARRQAQRETEHARQIAQQAQLKAHSEKEAREKAEAELKRVLAELEALKRKSS